MEYLGSDTTPASPRNLDEIITEGSVWKISDAVSKCTSLVKFYLDSSFPVMRVFPRYEDFELGAGAILFADKMLQLVDSLPDLVCLYCRLKHPESYTAAATKVLVDTVTPKRPSFRCRLLSQHFDNKHATSLPFVHEFDQDDFSALPYGGYY